MNYDITPPAISVDCPSKVYVNSVENFVVHVSDKHPDTFTIYKNGKVIWHNVYTNNTVVTLVIDTSKACTWNYTVVAYDKAGNVRVHVSIVKVVTHPSKKRTVMVTGGGNGGGSYNVQTPSVSYTSVSVPSSVKPGSTDTIKVEIETNNYEIQHAVISAELPEGWSSTPVTLNTNDVKAVASLKIHVPESTPPGDYHVTLDIKLPFGKYTKDVILHVSPVKAENQKVSQTAGNNQMQTNPAAGQKSSGTRSAKSTSKSETGKVPSSKIGRTPGFEAIFALVAIIAAILLKRRY